MSRRIQLLAALAAGLLLAGTTARGGINDCVEYGPYVNYWQCVLAGSNTSSGSLNFTNVGIYVGEPIVAPALAVGPAFGSGLMRRWLTNDCELNPGGWQTNILRYLPGDLYFVPPIPATFDVAGTSNYTAYVDANPSSLLAWWPGEGNGSELLYTNTAVLTNGATYGAGKVGQGFSFDGSNDYAYVPDKPGLNIGVSNDFTIECWIKIPYTAYGTARHILGKLGDIGGREQGYALSLSSGTLTLAIFTSTGTYSNSFSSGTNLYDGNFHHLAVTVDRDSSTGFKMYKDGALSATGNPTGAKGDLSNTNLLSLGRYNYNGSSSGFFSGIIDEPSLYQCALSSNDVVALYNAGADGKRWTNSSPGAVAIPGGCTCNPVTATVGTLTITAASNTDSDGDGVSNAVEIAQGRNPNSPGAGSVYDTNNLITLAVFTPLK